MKLKKLRLVNYRNHTDTALDFTGASLIVIRGANASGKSSIGQAISVNLTNTTMGLDTQGKGFTAKIKDGDSKAVITAEIQGKHLLKNVITLNTNTSGRTSDVECLDEPDDNRIVNGFSNFLKDRKDAILVACNTDFYPRLDEKAQVNLLAKQVLPTRYDFPKDKIEETNGFLDTPINFNAEPFEVITKAHKALYKERETTNRQESDLRKSIPDALPIPKGVDSESLQTQLIEIKAKRSNLQLERDTAVATANNIEVKRATLQTKRESLLRRRDEDQKKLASAEAKLLSAEQEKAFTETVAKAEELANLKSQHSSLHGGMIAVNEQISRLKDISEKGATCPTCDQDIDAGKIAGLIADLEKEYADADQKIQKLDTQIEAIGDVIAAKESLKNHELAVKGKAEIETSLEETVKEGKKTRADLDALPEASNATLPFNDPLADLQAKEDKINEQLRPVIAAEERAKEIKRLTEQKGKLEKKAATLDSLVKYFDKDGVKKTLISEYIGSFESKINSVMNAFGYKTALTMDPFSFEVTTARGYVGPVKELSGAEEHIFKVAFQCAVSIAAGINLVVIDEIEELGEDIRPALFGSVLSLIDKGSLEQAILIGFSLDKTLPPKEKRAPGTKWFYVEDGTVEELK
jgi:DNA repair exonuclease SbcCD ATPase subunit